MIDLKGLSKFEQVCITTNVISKPLTYHKSELNKPLFLKLWSVLPSNRKYSDELWFIISCMVKAINNGKLGVHISLQNEDYSTARKLFNTNVSKPKLQRLLTVLENEEVLTVYRGYYDTCKGSKQTCILFNEEWLRLVGKDFPSEGEFNYVEVKCNKTGELLPVENFYGNKKIIKEVKDYDNVLSNTEIKVNGVVVRPKYKRLFTDNLTKQGRYYTNDDFLSLSKDMRSTITFWDEVVIGYDIISTHPSILYEIEGVRLTHDPYYVEGVERGFCKFLLMCALYNDNKRDCINAVRKKITKDKRKKKVFSEVCHNYTYKDIAGICDQLIFNNKPIEKYFLSDKMLWAKLQNIDSAIATYVIKDFIPDKQPILLWHDEYLVAESLEDKLIESIPSAWKKVLGSNMNCKIKKEF